MCARRIDPEELGDVAPDDDELPDYEASVAAPPYNSEGFDEPLLTYHLRRHDRRLQLLVPYGSHARSSYRIITNGFRMFSKKPDMEILHISPHMQQRNIAVLGFDDDGPLPWRPRAHFDHVRADGTIKTHPMEARDFSNWVLTLDDRKYGWTLCTSPCSLVFQEQDTDITTARFMYSALGTRAQRGAKVGELTIFRDRLTMEVDGVDQIIGSLMVAITHLQRQGKYYSNVDGEQMRAYSVSRETYPMHRVLSVGFSMS